MKSKDIKKYCNIIVLCITIFSVIMLLKFSDLPNVFNLSFMNKPENISNIQMSLYTSFVVTAVFYLFINFIPDKIKEKEEMEINLPYRCNMHRDIQLFLSDTLSLWSQIYKDASKKDKSIDIRKIKNVQELFNEELFKKVCLIIKIFGKSNYMGMDREYLLWAQVLPGELEKIVKRGNDILNKYSRDIPPNVYYSIHYLIGQSPIIGIPASIIRMFIQQIDKEQFLASLIPIEISGNIELRKTTKSIDEIYRWVNDEYICLSKEISEENEGQIFSIDIRTYLK